ncbi:MAG: pantoate--beta-alanine ligase [Flavobacteriales bacterium]|nr:pantoate--beta-alanine ligase [Flavobacteriales bacterium]
MFVAKTKQEIDRLIPRDRKVGFVPTMGALHDGHASLVAASNRDGHFTVASIFVNPTQFNDPKDFEKYPVDTERDLKTLEAAGCDLAFLPTRSEIYPAGTELDRYIHDFGAMENRFEGAFRPGHFRGVGQVVHILFETVRPDMAFFGEKDFQQLQVIKQLAKQLGSEIEIKGMPTVREPDGLAMSSRNRRLDPAQRTASTLLYEVLTKAAQALGKQGLDAIRAEVQRLFETNAHLRLEYFDIIDPATFLPRKDGDPGVYQAVIAAYAGDVRLIDNLRLD